MLPWSFGNPIPQRLPSRSSPQGGPGEGGASHLLEVEHISGTHWVLVSTLAGRYLYPHFTDAELEALKDEVT